MRRIKWISLFLAMGLLLVCAGSALADAGGFSGDSDYGGGWDFGGSDWDSDSWDSGGSIFFLGGGDGDGGGGVPFWAFLVALVVVIVWFRSKRGKGNASRSGSGTGGTPGAALSRPEGENIGVDGIRRGDPNFSEQLFLEDVANRYVKLQNAWTSQDWEPMRMLMTDALYAQFERQLNAMRQKGYVNHVDRIAVLGTRILGCWQDAGKQSVTVELRTRIVDYTVDASGKVVQGNPNKELFMGYEWTMIRSRDAKTDSFEGERRTACPACGAPVLLNASNRCEYCGSLLSASEHGWVVSAIRGLYQRSGS